VQSGKSSVRVLLRIDPYTNVRCAKLVDHRVEVAYAQVNRPRMFRSAEVLCALRKRREDSRACLLMPRMSFRLA
jgi:hypothetical protein